jgi:NAD(P)H-nitrite reductase large subunit
MAIPYFLTGMIDEAGTTLRKTAGHYDDLGIRIRHGRIERVLADDGKLALAGGGSVAFERLLLATGARPVRPPIEGLDLPGVHPCWTLEDARDIVRLAEPGARVVLLGAGFIGCIILESLVARGVELTVVEMGDRMVPRMLDATAGGMLKRWCEGKGIKVLTSTSITRITSAKDGGEGLAVELSDGQTTPAHLVVIAAGVRANMEILDGSGIKTDQGVLVDRHLRSSHPNVYAAGDVAQGPDFSTGGFSVHAVQPTAADHGRIAALNMAGGEAAYKGSLVMNVLDTVGLVSCSFGRWQGADDGERTERLDEDAYKYINLQFENDRLIGAISLGRTDWVGVLRGLIQTEVPLGPWKDKLIADPHRLMEAYLARVGT